MNFLKTSKLSKLLYIGPTYELEWYFRIIKCVGITVKRRYWAYARVNSDAFYAFFWLNVGVKAMLVKYWVCWNFVLDFDCPGKNECVRAHCTLSGDWMCMCATVCILLKLLKYVEIIKLVIMTMQVAFWQQFAFAVTVDVPAWTF